MSSQSHSSTPSSCLVLCSNALPPLPLPRNVVSMMCRVAEINKKRELDHQLQAKEYEISMAKRLALELKNSSWLKTATSPGLLWLPKHHNDNTTLLLEQRSIELEAWKVRPLLPVASKFHHLNSLQLEEM